MKQYKFLTMTALALTMGFSSCNNDDVTTHEGQIKGEPTAMNFTLTMPHIKTYAATDANASSTEYELNKVNVLIYGETTPNSFVLEQNKELDMTDFELVSGTVSTYNLKPASKITTTTGKKKIFVAMNFDGPYPAVFDPVTNLPGLIHTLTASNSLSSNGIAMFSTAETLADLVTESDANHAIANKKTIKVKRLVAKISVQELAALRTAGKIMSQGGELTNLQFALGNANKTTFLLQKVEGNVVRDNNWASFAAADFFPIPDYTLASTAYQPVDAATATITAGTIHPVYAPENTAQTYNEDGNNLTYISVRAQYAPGFFCTSAGASKGANTTGPKSFWTVTKAGGEILYFDEVANATTYQAATTGSVMSAEYKSGLCYFRAYLNPTGTHDSSITGSSAAKFDVLRNNYYKTTIKSIKAPGMPTDEGKVVERTSIDVDVDVDPWQTVEDGYDL